MLKRTCILCLFAITYSLTAQKPGDKVLSVFVDEYGHQWFGTDSGLLLKNSDVYKAYFTGPDIPGTVNDIEHQDTPEGPVMWIGTNSGIIRISYLSDVIISGTFYTAGATKFQSDIINAIAFDNKNTGFFTTSSGIGIFAKDVWSYISKIKDIDKNKFTAAKAKGDTIYLGTNGEGVARMVKTVDGYSGASSFVNPWSALTGNNITCIFIDSKGYQWYGTDKGISRHSKMDAKEGWDFSLTDQLPNQYITCISEDNYGNIWIGTRGGLVKLSPYLSVAATFTESNGLPSCSINDIFIEKDGSIWVGTDLGAAQFKGSSISNIRTSEYTKNFISF